MKIVKITLDGINVKEEVIMEDMEEKEACEACELLNEFKKDLKGYFQVLPE